MIRYEAWYRYAAAPEWYAEVMNDPKVAMVLRRIRDSKWGRLLRPVERSLGELAASAYKGALDRHTFEAVVDALEANLDVMDRRAELAAVRSPQSTASWMQQAAEKMTRWLSGYSH